MVEMRNRPRELVDEYPCYNRVGAAIPGNPKVVPRRATHNEALVGPVPKVVDARVGQRRQAHRILHLRPVRQQVYQVVAVPVAFPAVGVLVGVVQADPVDARRDRHRHPHVRPLKGAGVALAVVVPLRLGPKPVHRAVQGPQAGRVDHLRL